MDRLAHEIIAECKRQHESCNYTAAALYSWLKEIRAYRIAFITLPILFGSIASAKILLKEPDYDWLTAIASLLAGLFPAIFKALDLDVSIKAVSDSAYRFEVLRDRFRQASLIGTTRTANELEAEFKELMDRLDEARSYSPAVPERHFNVARKKIKRGHYDFAVDAIKK